MVRAVMRPVSGTFELRWQWHRGDTRAPDRRLEIAEPSAVSLDGAAPPQMPRAAVIATARPRLDGVSPGP